MVQLKIFDQGAKQTNEDFAKELSDFMNSQLKQQINVNYTPLVKPDGRLKVILNLQLQQKQPMPKRNNQNIIPKIPILGK